VQVLNTNGGYIYEFGTVGTDDGKLYCPNSFSFDKMVIYG